MDEELFRKMREVERSAHELKEKSEAKLDKEYSSVSLIILRDACIDYIDELETLRERMEDEQ